MSIAADRCSGRGGRVAAVHRVRRDQGPLEHPIVCGSDQAGGGPPNRSLPGARLDVELRRGGYEIEFDAAQGRPGGRTGVTVEVEEHRGAIEINRVIWTPANGGALRYDRWLRSATLKPPAPSSGRGRFHRTARPANRWTGDLTVDLPGRSDVPLAGPGFWADLERPRR